MKQLTPQDLNPAVLNVQYAVRGELAIKADDLRAKLEMGYTLPFKRVINSNIGNPQQKGLDQPPITFSRQVSHFLPRACSDARRECIPRSLPPKRLADTLCDGLLYNDPAGRGAKRPCTMLTITYASGRRSHGVSSIARTCQGQVAKRRYCTGTGVARRDWIHWGVLA